MTVDQIAAGSNGLWAGGAFLVILLISKGMTLSRKHRRELPRDAKLLCAGAVCSSIGVLLHRGYWNLAIWGRHEFNYAEWAIEQRYIPSAAVLLIICGIVIATARYGALYFGPVKWPAIVLVSLAVSCLGSITLAS